MPWWLRADDASINHRPMPRRRTTNTSHTSGRMRESRFVSHADTYSFFPSMGLVVLTQIGQDNGQVVGRAHGVGVVVA
jgi:hypothetical protein